jgi:hypothetical protein
VLDRISNTQLERECREAADLEHLEHMNMTSERTNNIPDNVPLDMQDTDDVYNDDTVDIESPLPFEPSSRITLYTTGALEAGIHCGLLATGGNLPNTNFDVLYQAGNIDVSHADMSVVALWAETMKNPTHIVQNLSQSDSTSQNRQSREYVLPASILLNIDMGSFLVGGHRLSSIVELTIPDDESYDTA